MFDWGRLFHVLILRHYLVGGFEEYFKAVLLLSDMEKR